MPPVVFILKCRIYKTYDFKSFIEKVIGPLWPVFDALYVILMVFIIAIMAAATGSIVQSVLHLPTLFGEGLVILIVGILNFYGDEIIEKFETVGTVLLYAGYILFTITSSPYTDIILLQEYNIDINIKTLEVILTQRKTVSVHK